MLYWCYVIRSDKVIRQLAVGFIRHGLGIWVNHRSVSQEFKGEYVHLLLGLFAYHDDISCVMMGEARFDAVAGIVRQ